VAVSGCASFTRRPVPEPLIDSVCVPHLPRGIRTWGDRHSEVLQRSLQESFAQTRRAYGDQEPMDILSISSGGIQGAYAAGVLCGWTEHGTRPVFRVVSGVSIGAIIAPFAFLGSSCDVRLREMAKSATRESIYRMRWLPLESLTDNRPLARFVGRYYDRDVLDAIAAEHAKGRRLFIATTNLDAGRPVIWDMGAIASSGTSEALRLFRQVIVASAASPVIFPPTYIRVEHDGQTYDEMHVDGAVTAQIMLYGQALTAQEVRPEFISALQRGTYYVILNRKLRGDCGPVEPSIRSIAIHSISRLMQDQGAGDLWQAYAACRRDGLAFRLAAIPDDEALPAEPRIDTQIQTRLFDRGYAMGRDGYPWADQPPGLRPAPPAQGSSAADGGAVAAESDNRASVTHEAAGSAARGVTRLESDGGRLDH
jgi:predicted patatin/cPLA2 family phospholipase